eukprot:3512598-Alexandrium_andersonii.AAC.1
MRAEPAASSAGAFGSPQLLWRAPAPLSMAPIRHPSVPRMKQSMQKHRPRLVRRPYWMNCCWKAANMTLPSR